MFVFYFGILHLKIYFQFCEEGLLSKASQRMQILNIYIIFLFKILNKNIKNIKVCNSLSGLIINSVNFLFIFIGSHYAYNTKILSILIILLICIYLLFYFILKNLILQKSNNNTDF